MKKVVFFDVDNVLVQGQSQMAFVVFLLKNKRVSWGFFLNVVFQFLLYKIGILKNLDLLRERSLEVLCGWEEKETKDLFEEFYRVVLRKHVLQGGVDLIRHHLMNGNDVVLMSASLAEIVEPLRQELGINHLIATNLEVNGGRYTGKILGPVPYGNNKTILALDFMARNSYSKEDAYAYADHSSDIGLLRSVKYVGAVNPDKGLEIEARHQHWPIYRFNDCCVLGE
jgi:HAD superfamily hydrolase (TIGR01490 family)